MSKDDRLEMTEIYQKLKHGSSEEIQSTLSTLLQNEYCPSVVFIDTGLVSTLTEVNRVNFLDLFEAIAHFDGKTAAQLMITRSVHPETVIDPDQFVANIERVVTEVKHHSLHLRRFSVTAILTEVLLAVRSHHVKLEGEFVKIAISLLVLEGIGRQLHPELDLLSAAIPILRKLARPDKSSLEKEWKTFREKGLVVNRGQIKPKLDFLLAWGFLELRHWLLTKHYTYTDLLSSGI
jgi:predicted unusual protein kinase regulating ubiquinone biosynthesis (AarF/ABC1/UbiB family)